MKRIIRTPKKEGFFTMLDNDLIKNPNLSHEEIGFMVRILMEQDDYNFSINDFLAKYPDGRDKNYRIYNALIKKGYILPTQETEKNGKFGSNDVIISESTVYWKPVYGKPVFGENSESGKKPTQSIVNKRSQPFTGNPYTVNPYSGTPFTGNPYTDESVDNTGFEGLKFSAEQDNSSIYNIYINNINNKYINKISNIDIQGCILDLATFSKFKPLQNINTLNKVILLHRSEALKFWIGKLNVIHEALQTKGTGTKDSIMYFLKSIYDSYQKNQPIKPKLPVWMEQFEKEKIMDSEKDITRLFSSQRQSLGESFIAFAKNISLEVLQYFDFKAGKTNFIGKHTKDLLTCCDSKNFDRVLGILDDVFIKDKYQLSNLDKKEFPMDLVNEVKNNLLILKEGIHNCEHV